MKNPLSHIKSTILGVLFLATAVIYQFSPILTDKVYTPNIWAIGGLYLSSVILLLFEPEMVKKIITKIVNKFL